MDITTIKNLMNAGFITQVVDPNDLVGKSVEELMEMGFITQVVDKDELEVAVTCTPENHCDSCTCEETPTEPEQTTTPSDEELLNQMIEEENNQ